MRVADVFKRVLGLGALSVCRVEVVDGDGERFVEVEAGRRRNRRMFCSGCGGRCTAIYDRGVRRWRHLDVFRVRCVLVGEVRRVSCPSCGVKSETVPWARPGARVTRAFEDTCVWLARSAPKSVVAKLQRVDWHSVGVMIERVVAEHTRNRAGDGLDGLRRIGIDEIHNIGSAPPS